MNKLLKFSQNHPLLIVIGLYLINYIVRYIDIIVLNNYYEKQWLILSKLVSLLIIFLYMRISLMQFNDIGLTKLHIPKNISTGLIYACIIVIPISLLVYANWTLYNYKPNIVFEPLDLYTLYLILFFIVNSIMEEGLFRGLFMRIIQHKYSIQYALILQAVLFAAWHIINWYLNQTYWDDEYMIKCYGDYYHFWTKFLYYLLPFIDTFLFSVIIGILYIKTKSLWSTISLHFFYDFIKTSAYITTTNESTSYTDIVISQQYYQYIPLIILQAGIIIYLWKQYQKEVKNVESVMEI
jgi:membrane protease YdiL (CAAX protease family)